jgi:hypothetical protein
MNRDLVVYFQLEEANMIVKTRSSPLGIRCAL